MVGLVLYGQGHVWMDGKAISGPKKLSAQWTLAAEASVHPSSEAHRDRKPMSHLSRDHSWFQAWESFVTPETVFPGCSQLLGMPLCFGSAVRGSADTSWHLFIAWHPRCSQLKINGERRIAVLVTLKADFPFCCLMSCLREPNELICGTLVEMVMHLAPWRQNANPFYLVESICLHMIDTVCQLLLNVSWKKMYYD